MSLRRARLEIAKDLLFAEQAAGRARIVGHEHRRRGVHVPGKPFEHGADFRLALRPKRRGRA